MTGKRYAKQTKDEEIHARLCNWGRWLRYDPGQSLGYPTKSPFVFSPRAGGGLIADLDAEHIEWIVSSLGISGLERGELYAFVLKVEYAERPEHAMPHVSQRAADVKDRFRCPCAERTYYHHLAKAREAVHTFADPIK